MSNEESIYKGIRIEKIFWQKIALFLDAHPELDFSKLARIAILEKIDAQPKAEGEYVRYVKEILKAVAELRLPGKVVARIAETEETAELEEQVTMDGRSAREQMDADLTSL